MEVIYQTISITAKQKSFIETLLITFSIISRIVFVGQSVLIIASKAANGPLVFFLFSQFISAVQCHIFEFATRFCTYFFHKLLQM